MSISYLADISTALKVAAVAGLNSTTTGRTAPTGYRDHAVPDLEQCCDEGLLTVWLEGITHRSTDPLDQFRQSCHLIATGTWVITLGRCLQEERELTTAMRDEDAAELLEDLWALLTELYDRLYANTLIPNTNCKDVTIGSATPLEASGACGGWEIRVSVNLNDSGPTGS